MSDLNASRVGWVVGGAALSAAWEPTATAAGIFALRPVLAMPTSLLSRLAGLASACEPNAAFRAFTGRVPSGDVAPALVCVATRDISTDDVVVAPDPWS